MESLSQEELRKALECVVQLAACPVCHETLTPKVALCVRGHAVCESCRQRLQKPECPLCRASFSSVQPTGFIRQLIETLPHPCRHKNCDYFVRTDDKHENFCTFKLTKCRYCDWSGAEKELVKHLKSDHPEVKKYLFPLLGNLKNGIPFNPKTGCSVFTPIFVDGHFFWGEMKNEPKDGKLTAIFHPVGNGKTSTEFQGSVRLGPRGSYNADIKLNMDYNVDPYVENCISIPTSILHKCTQLDDTLEYRLGVEITKLKSLVSLVESGMKAGIEYFKF